MPARVGICIYCDQNISQDRDGYWGTEDINDSHPWWCSENPDADKYHEPRQAEGMST